MKEVFTYIKVYSLFLFRIITLRIYIEILFWITTLLWKGIINLFTTTHLRLPEYSYINVTSFGVATILAIQTTYLLNGKKYKVWKGEFGMSPEKIKETSKPIIKPIISPISDIEDNMCHGCKINPPQEDSVFCELCRKEDK